MTPQAAWAFGDELRVGRCGQVRRVWAPRGVKVRQRVQRRREWRDRALAGDGRRATLRWCWLATRTGPASAEAVRAWRAQGLEAVVWDGARGHRAPAVRRAGVPLRQQPPSAPALQPDERVFEGRRREAAGKGYASVDEKGAAVERELQALAADPERVQSLAGWHWIDEAGPPSHPARSPRCRN